MDSIIYGYDMVELYHLRHVVAVLDTGSFSAAARHLHISQPALTKSIRRIEQVLGAPLFDRMPKPVPTRFGQLIGRHARILLAGAGDLEQAVALFRGLASGELNIGAGPVVADTLAGPAIGRLLQRHPKLRILVHVDNFSRFPDMLRIGEIDFFVADITQLIRAADLDIQPLPGQEIVWFCRPGHPLLAKKKISRTDVLGYPVVAPELPRWAAEQLQTPGLAQVRPTVICSHYSTLMHIVVHSDCVSGALEPTVAAEFAAGRLVRIPVRDLVLHAHPGIVALRNRALSPAARALMEEIQRGAKRLPGARA
jgi:DNA-binding transcriptional LysR family regulator